MTCPHMNFAAEVDVHRLTDGTDAVTGYAADVRIRCADCNLSFQFLGLLPGVDTRGATVSIDALEAHLALAPEGQEVSPLGRIAAHFAPERKQ